MNKKRLPEFIVAGAQKAGSTWLAEMLGNHPDLYVPGRELHFFDQDENFERGLDWYSELFAGATAGQVCGEKTPDYLLVERKDGSRRPAAERIRAALPDVKLLFVLRNPVTRAISALRHHLWFRRFPVTVSPTELLFGTHRERAEEWSILSNGQYALQLEHYHKLFAPDQIRVWIFEEDVRQHPLKLIKEAAGFIGVSEERAEIQPNRVSNRGVKSTLALRGNYYLPFLSAGWQVLDRMLDQPFDVSQDCLERLAEFYRPDIARLEQLLNRDLSVWRQT